MIFRQPPGVFCQAITVAQVPRALTVISCDDVSAIDPVVDELRLVSAETAFDGVGVEGRIAVETPADGSATAAELGTITARANISGSVALGARPPSRRDTPPGPCIASSCLAVDLLRHS